MKEKILFMLLSLLLFLALKVAFLYSQAHSVTVSLYTYCVSESNHVPRSLHACYVVAYPHSFCIACSGRRDRERVTQPLDLKVSIFYGQTSRSPVQYCGGLIAVIAQ